MKWFRHYVGMTRDDKLFAVAAKTRQPLDRVMFVWVAILESASECEDGGRYAVDPEMVAYTIRCEPSDIVSIMLGLEVAERVSDGVVIKWKERQFESDTSRDRMRRHRNRKNEGGNGPKEHLSVTENPGDKYVTSQISTVTTPEAEADTETEAEAEAEADTETEPNPEAQQPYDPAAARQAHAKRFEADDGPADDFREAERACVKALGGSGGQGGIAPADAFFGPIMALVDQGFRLPDIVSVLKSERHRRRPKPVKSWSLWATIVAEQLAARPKLTPAKPADDPDDPRFDFGGGYSAPLSSIRQVVARGHWLDQWGPRLGQPGCIVPEHLVGVVH